MKEVNRTVPPIVLPDGVGHVLVALSGGADSVYLLHALIAGGAYVSAAHFHHGLRGSDADEDLRFCRKLCEKLDVELYEGDADVALYAIRNGMGVESAARKLRYRFLQNIQLITKADVIALGHHLNDQAETVLMHLLRGSGLRGACGMTECEGDLYRPLLGMTKQQIVDELRGQNIPWREDATNFESDNPRNALRNEILPQIRAIYPGAEAALSRFAKIAREDWQLLEEMTEQILHDQVWVLPNGWRLDGVQRIAEPLLRRLLMRLTGIREMQTVSAMAEIAKSGCKKAEFTHFRLEQHGENLYIIDVDFCPPDEVEFVCDGESILPGLCRMTAEEWAPEPVLSGGMVQVLNKDSLQGAVLRTRRNGDRIRPLGAAGTKSLSDYLIDKKVPRPARDVLPLLARGNEVLWVVGVGISEEVRVTPDSAAVRVSCDMAEEHA